MTRPVGPSNVSAFSFGRGRAELPVMVPRFPLICAKAGRPGLCTSLMRSSSLGASDLQRLLNLMRQQPNTVATPATENLRAVFIKQAIARHAP